MSKIGIIAAMPEELEALKEAVKDIQGDIVLSLSGIGKVNAARAGVEMILKERPDCIINSGVAGGMVEGMHPGDIVISERVAYHDVWCGNDCGMGRIAGLPQYFISDKRLVETARKTLENMGGSIGVASYFGLVTSGDQFFISLEEDARIRNLYPDVLAADMESGALAQICHLYGVPFINCRVLSDIHTTAEIQKATYDDFLTEIDGAKFEFLKVFLALCTELF